MLSHNSILGAKEFYKMRIALKEAGRPPIRAELVEVVRETDRQLPDRLTLKLKGISQDPNSDLEELKAEVRPEDVLEEMDAAERRLRRG